jgi:hypothetical protein
MMIGGLLVGLDSMIMEYEKFHDRLSASWRLWSAGIVTEFRLKASESGRPMV